MPIYKGVPSTVAKRRDNLMGFVLGVYRISNIFTSSSLNDSLLGIEMKLIDETLSSGHDILHIHKSRTGFTADESITYRKELPVIWGRKWSLIASPTLSYIAVRRDMLPLATFVSGIIFTLFIALLESTEFFQPLTPLIASLRLFEGQFFRGGISSKSPHPGYPQEIQVVHV